MICSKCGNNMADDDMFCRKCGNKKGTCCPKCGAVLNIEDTFCGKCGTVIKQYKQESDIPYTKRKEIQKEMVVDYYIFTSRCFNYPW